MPINKHTTYLVSLIALSFTVATVVYSEEAFASAVQGLTVWWDVVFPALLPFFIGSQVLMALGVVHFMGVLLEPLMRPLFDIPGTGSFVMAMGFASGYPVASVLTTELRRKELCSRIEGERLMSFTTTADPLFMSGAVAVGMFASPEVAGIFLAAQYLSAVMVGLIMRFHGPPQDRFPGSFETTWTRNIIPHALQALCEARERDGRPIGKLLGDAVEHAVRTLLAIGGFIILFSVMIRILGLVGIGQLISSFFRLALPPLGLSPGLSEALLNGLFEVTLGTRTAAGAGEPFYDRIIIANVIMAWGGLSVHAQVASIISGTKMSMKPFVMARILHAFLAGSFSAVLLWAGTFSGHIPTLLPVPSAHLQYITAGQGWAHHLTRSAGLFALTSAGLLGLSVMVGLSRTGASLFRFHHRRRDH